MRVQNMNSHINQSMRGFFSHVSFLLALQHGWDLENNISEFWDNVCKEAPEQAMSAYVFLVQKDGSKKEMTRNEVFQAAKGYDSPGLNAYAHAIMRGVNASPKGFFDPTSTVDISMHSGSSDYLFLSDILEYLEVEGLEE